MGQSMKLRQLLKEMNTQVPRFANELKSIYDKYLGRENYTTSKIDNGVEFSSNIQNTNIGKTSSIIPNHSGGISHFKNSILHLKSKYKYVDVDWSDSSKKGQFVVKITNRTQPRVD